MTIENFLDSRRGQAMLWQRRKRNHQMFSVHIEPGAKNQMRQGGKDLMFQREVMQRQAEMQRRAFTSDLALELWFLRSDDRRSPATLANTTKNLVDLLKTPLDRSASNRKNVLMQDDRQIKLLCVHYTMGTSLGVPIIHAGARPMREMRQDAELALRILDDDFTYDEWERRELDRDLEKKMQELQAKPPAETCDEDTNESLLKFYREERAKAKSRGEAAMAKLGESWVLGRQQDSFLQLAGPTFKDWLKLLAPSRGVNYGSMPTGDILSEIERINRNMILSHPFSVDLRHQPSSRPEHLMRSKQFEQNAREALKDFRKRFHFLFPLMTQIDIVIIIIPSEGPDRIDLDNLAMPILKGISEVLKPPSTNIDAGEVSEKDLDSMPGSDAKTLLEELLRNKPLAPKHSVRMCQVVEFSRGPEDPREGSVRLMISGGESNPHTIISRIDGLLDAWYDSLDL